ncbi:MULTISPECIES: hypothetical protein [Phytobacter]|uniref:Uncharacterized protein n=1 Tax=Phytobacter diazotrophicus TaxID=395631 RepID=A0ABN6LRJ2_9ENTR|nr:MULTISPECIES: hypothetical protein [Phytobacter]BBE78458.1 hypothetical protein MRY16398_35140 [Phytobacter sp. MRY16-398]BDD51831.1 hypothetical protein PDTA9734_33180 [Phytobacter diazotrophicus]BEG82760.1 hypothetical protein PDTA9730_32160 [Phytobacter diazotrophicus]BEG88659.1 hypothetical protein PDTA9759_33150 [Phytobacter diazotrophicus]BEG94423.1 hypothetical protein PDTA9832_32820 [Phytobacter diazotrophicus]
MSKELSGAAGDVLHALFFRGALVDGDLPSKAGANELRELGYVMTQDTVTPFDGENHYNFLTPTGQEFAISYLVESRFGKKADFQIGAGETFINNTTLQGNIHLTAASDQCLMEPLTDTASACDNIRVLNKPLFGINSFSTAIVKLSDEMREAIIAAVRDSGQFVEKPTGDEQQSVEFRADRLKATVGVNDSGESTIQQQIQQAANLAEAMRGVLSRHESALAGMASARAAITESINQAVNDAIVNALRPGGVLYAFRTRT